MIISNTVKFKKPADFDSKYIEAELVKLGKTLVRWAVIDADADSLTVSVSYIN